MSTQSASSLPPLALAFVGDALYSLFVRKWLVEQGEQRVGRLHKACVALVRAEAQARALRALGEQLSDEEAAIARRGRNAKGGVPRGLSPGIYRASTAFETLLGSLYLDGHEARAYELMQMAVEASAPEQDKR